MSLFNGNELYEAQRLFLYWIQERELVRKRKEAGEPKPWSSDPVFQRTYFCNVRREDDKVTKWIRQNWSPEKIGWEDYECAMVIARMLNWPDTLGALTSLLACGIYDGWFEELKGDLNKLAVRGKVWGNAYVVTTHGLKMGKIDYLCDRVLPAAYSLLGAGRWRGAYHAPAGTLAQRHGQLIQLEGLASFMAAQVIADLKNTPGHPLAEAKDWWSWAAPGPGSLRGLEWFYGRKVPFDTGVQEIREWLIGMGITLNAQDVQNCLCEYDKYMRVKNGTGRSKRNYPGI